MSMGTSECDITDDYATTRLARLGCLPITTRGGKRMFYLPSESTETPMSKGVGNFPYHEVRAQRCRGHLASILGKDELNLVTALIPGKHKVWLGGRRIKKCNNEDPKDCWEWSDGRTLKNNDAWANGQPTKLEKETNTVLHNGSMRAKKFWAEYRGVYLLPYENYEHLENLNLPVCNSNIRSPAAECPDNCSTWFDGCNICECGADETTCTEMYCLVPREKKCLQLK